MLPVSAGLHLAALAALLPWPAGTRRPETPPVEVELIQQAAQTPGAPAAADTAASASPAAPPPADQPPANPLPLPPPPPPVPPDAVETASDLPTPPQPPDAVPEPNQPRSAAARAPSAVSLGNADESRDSVDVTGRNVVPPAPDSRFRNQPPTYPAAAARIGAQGTVGLRVQVSAAGVPTEVAVASSSGNPILDGEARTAVRRWRFTPARIQGTPVPFEYTLDIRFILGDTP